MKRRTKTIGHELGRYIVTNMRLRWAASIRQVQAFAKALVDWGLDGFVGDFDFGGPPKSSHALERIVGVQVWMIDISSMLSDMIILQKVRQRRVGMHCVGCREHEEL